MTQKLILLLAFMLIVTPLQSQDLFDEENTLKYANYLYQRGNYQLAIPEYERLVYFDPARRIYKLQLLETYFRTQAYDQIEQSIERWSPRKIEFPFSLYYLKAQLKTQNFTKAQHILNDDNTFRFPANKRVAYQLVSYGLAGQWYKAAAVCQIKLPVTPEPSFQQYCTIVGQADAFNEKNRFLAAGLSTIVPGLGKVYTRDYVDAAVNFLFIGVTAFQAYRGFTNDDIREVQGWIYGGVALSFYLGNIYGSWKAADQYNYRFYESKQQTLDRAFFSNESLDIQPRTKP